MLLAHKLQHPLDSVDERVTVRQDPAECGIPESHRSGRVEVLIDREEVVRSFGPGRGFGTILGLSADGRLAFADTPAGFAVLDLAEGVWNEPLTDEDDSREPIETDDSRLQNEADSPLPATEQEAVLLQMGVAVIEWGLGANGTVVPANDVRFENWAATALSGRTFRPFEDDDGQCDIQALDRIYSGLRRQSDHQLLCRFPQASRVIASPDGTRWSLDPSGESAQEQVRQVVDIVTGTPSTLSGSGKPVGWTGDGRLLIIAEEKAGLKFWNSAASAWAGKIELPLGNLPEDPNQLLAIDEDSIPVGSMITTSSDGRRVAWCGYYEAPSVVTIKNGAVTRFPDVMWAGAHDLKFSADGQYLVTTYQMYDGSTGGHFLWDVQTGECLDLIGDDCDIEGVRVSAPEPVIPWVTGVRIFRPESTPALEDLHEPLYPNGRIPGRFDEEITFRCQHCGRRSPLPADTQDCIRSIHRTARLSDEDSPVLKLPDAAWQDPGLSLECPNCHQPHKSTPFVVDRQRELSDRPQ